MKICLINPPLLGMKNDPFGSIPSLPVGTPYLAAALQAKGFEVDIIDCFGEAPDRFWDYLEKYTVRGLPPEEAVEMIPPETDVVGISVHSGAVHSLSGKLIELVKEKTGLTVVAGGGHATVCYREFLDFGADYVVLGEGEDSFYLLLKALERGDDPGNIDGLAGKGFANPKTRFIEDLDSIHFPALEKLPVENYWKLGYAHGPVSGKYTFLITSRGCPYDCNFCAAPAIWQRKWRSRSVENIIQEIESDMEKYGICDFHIQDDIFTCKKERVQKFCRELINRKLGITWCLAAGTKAETIDAETLALMKQAGCRYISVSPESGSKRVLSLMNKPFDHAHFQELMRTAHRLKLKVQACFVLGYPGETDEDRKETRTYIKDITKAGVDEIAVFIMTPLPGAKVYQEKWDFKEYEELSFSPRWRKDYPELAKYRKKFFLTFFLYKIIYHPFKMMRHLINIALRRFETKSEMTVYRMIKTFGRKK